MLFSHFLMTIYILTAQYFSCVSCGWNLFVISKTFFKFIAASPEYIFVSSLTSFSTSAPYLLSELFCYWKALARTQSLIQSWSPNILKHHKNTLNEYSLVYIIATSIQFLLKVVSPIFLLVSTVCLKESTCETRKNVFCFTLKALFVLVIITF